MNAKKKILFIGIIIFLIAIVGVVHYYLSPTRGWKTYTNTRFGYTLKYPPDETVSIIGGEGVLPPIEELDDPVIGDVMGLPPFGIDTYISQKSSKQLLALSLHDLAEKIREDQLSDKNIYEPNKQTGSLLKITFAGQTAYSFTQTDSFGGPSGGYILLPMGSAFNYIFIENHAGIKLMLRYLVGNKTAEQIMHSFKLIN